MREPRPIEVYTDLRLLMRQPLLLLPELGSNSEVTFHDIVDIDVLDLVQEDGRHGYY